jgi:hypothetical protein
MSTSPEIESWFVDIRPTHLPRAPLCSLPRMKFLENGIYSKWWVPALWGADMAQTTREGISNEPWSTEDVGEGACSAAIATSTLQVGFYLTVLHRQPTGSPTSP